MTDIFEANGCRFIADDDMIVRWCRQTGKQFEPETTAWMFGVMAERDGAFIDVGASTGWFSIPMAIRGREVHAYEPNKRVFPRLLENAALNGVTISAHPYALSQDAGEAVFWHNPHVLLTSGGSIEVATCHRPQSDAVETRRFDDEAAASLPIALIKIDVEGHEAAVLDGATETIIWRWRPRLMLEANTKKHEAVLAAWLNQAGYEYAKADDRNMLCTPIS